MKRLFYAFTLTLFCSMAFAQQGFHSVGVGIEGALPLGNFGEAYGIGYGATGKAFYGITEKGDITGTLGYIRFGMKESSAMVSGSMGMIPIMFGYRHDFGGLYGEPQLGLTMVKSRIKMDLGDFGDLFGGIGANGSGSTTKVSFGLGGGYAMGKLDFGARFQIVDSFNFLGLRIGYNFSLGN
ncbi:hypothetical protein [Sphingobacterium faecale]|uniref:Outer membrane protein beta-barrel domain-containing protein n=1 Tax=Sphingobacterium faecale TaxID=2803775 RepID=A0ABS1R0R7_9SPHI|nr:hypothetical protein [Sphingobacterium faecale]MBL1407844.1 hypothetical protein [Sphingobacterium faecale]